MPSFHLFPTLYEQADFLFSTHQRRETTSTGDVQSTLDTTLAQDVVHVEGLSHTSECLCAQGFAVNIALDQAIRHFTYDEGIGLSQSLDSRSNIGHFPQSQLFL